MNHLKEICCFCLKSTNVLFTDLFTKGGDGLTQFDKISTCFSQLVNILNENIGHKYMLCSECCDTIEMIYQFNQKCLNSLQIYLSNKTTYNKNNFDESDYSINIKTELDEDSTPIFESFHYEADLKTRSFKDKSEMLVDPLDVIRESKHNSKSLGATSSKTQTIKDFGNISDQSSSEAVYIKEEVNAEPIREEHFRVAEKKSLEYEVFGESSRQNRLFVEEKPMQINKKNFICDECGKTFNYKSKFDIHLRIHTGVKPFKCDICEKSFSHKFHLNSHRVIHTGEKPHQCDICNKLFTEKSSLAKHISIHAGEKPYSCDQCELRFNRKYSLIMHKRVHTGEKPYICDVCGKAFTQGSSLIVHKRIHTREKPYSCNFCAKTFRSKSDFNKHKRRAHSN